MPDCSHPLVDGEDWQECPDCRVMVRALPNGGKTSMGKEYSKRMSQPMELTADDEDMIREMLGPRTAHKRKSLAERAQERTDEGEIGMPGSERS